MSLAQILLASKQALVPEIEIHLFEDCNLSCGFCSQDHDSGVNFNFEKKLRLVNEFINTKKEEYNTFKVSIMGGELFQNKIESFTPYQEFIFEIKKMLTDKSVTFFMTSNLIFNNPTRLEELLKSLRSKGIDVFITTSFDFAGRGWTQQQRDLFKKNVIYLRSYIYSISVTLHKPGIQAMLNKTDKLYEFLYDNFKINFDWYVPDLKNAATFLPSDNDCKNALLYLARNYPNVHPIKEIVNQELNQIQCCSENRILIAANDSISNCQYLDYADNKFKGNPNKFTTFDMADRFVEEQGCATCEHIKHCGLYCYVAADYAKRNQNTLSCFIKEFYEEFPCK